MASRRKPNLALSVEAITPEIAEEWLQHNTFNRKVSERLVDIYAEAMAADEWALNGEPIIFDKSGRLQSGQHRLMACVQANVSFWSVVVRGAEPEAIYTLDSGRKRKITDVLTLRGEKNVMALSSALVWHWRYEHGLMDQGGISPATSHLLSVLDATPSLREDLSYGGQVKSRIGLSAGLYAALFHEFLRLNQTEAEAFHEALISGENLDSSSPIFVLRRWIIRSKLSDRRPPSQLSAAILIKAWNAYRLHETPRSLRWAANEAFPEAV